MKASAFSVYLMHCGVRKMNCLFLWLSATFNIMSMDILRFTMSWVEEVAEDSGYQQQYGLRL